MQDDAGLVRINGFDDVEGAASDINLQPPNGRAEVPTSATRTRALTRSVRTDAKAATNGRPIRDETDTVTLAALGVSGCSETRHT